MKFRLDVQKRLVILGLLPQKGDILTAITKVELEKAIGLDEAEVKRLNVQRLPDNRMQWNREPVLFSVDMEPYEKELNNCILPLDLYSKFLDKEVPLSPDAVLSKEREDRWLITDRDEIYILNKEEEAALPSIPGEEGVKEAVLNICQEPIKEIEISAGGYLLITDALDAQQKAKTLPSTATTIEMWEMFMKNTPDFGDAAEKQEGAGPKVLEPKA